MVKLCRDSLTYPSNCIFEGALQEGKYPDCWKKANVALVPKIESNGLMKKSADALYRSDL